MTVRTIATHSAETCRALARRGTGPVAGLAARAAELADRFDMVRTSTHLALATEELAATSVRQNDDMRRISAWVAIIAAPTLVTGFFGQNVPDPGFGQLSGFIVSTGVIVVAATVLYVLLKARRWL